MNTAEMKILRIRDLQQKLGIGRTTIYDWLQPVSTRYDDSFPKPIKFGGVNCWLSTDIDRWIESKFGIEAE